jgi:GT2 family glycosyltransferase/SAM-dependent methyltransferase
VSDTDLYDAYYFATGCGRPYQRDEEWLRFFGSVADRIMRDIRPSTVLDVGCAMGFLVEALRQRGAEAFGVDISGYAIENVHPDIQPYCWVGSVTDPFPRKYDLIVCIEVLEHLPHREVEQAIENLCRHSDDVLFSSTPLDYKEATHVNVQSPEYWAELFARHGFFRDVDFDASFITPWAVRFRKTSEPVARVVAAYERRFWRSLQENQARRELSIEQRNELAEKERAVQALTAQVSDWETRWTHLESSIGWAFLQRLQHLRARVAPPGSRREPLLDAVFRGLRIRKRDAFIGLMHLIRQEVSWQTKAFLWKTRLRVNRSLRSRTVQIDPIQLRAPVQAHQASVDIVICVHNALSDVQRCLEAVVRHTTPPYSLVLVDDGSESETHDYLSEFANSQGAVLLRNEEAKGYTRAANQGLQRSSADYVVLLNSDTVVTPEWLDRLIACAESDPRIGLVGPLSNTASWQSVPEIESQGDWAANPLPAGLTIEEMGQLVARYSARAYPVLPFLNGFCLLIRRQVIEQIGYFDEESFDAGYGEENDYCLRARKNEWLLALADDVYVYHRQGRSYSDERRKRLTEQADRTLIRKHGQRIVQEGVTICRHDRVMEGIRAHSRIMFEQREWMQKGREAFSGRRVLCILPVMDPGGGGSIVILKTKLMREMGVRAEIFNLRAYRDRFKLSYPTLDVPVVYGEVTDIPTIAMRYDAVIATANASVEWLVSAVSRNPGLVRGYFIQDFEPYFYPSDSEGYKSALASYSSIPDMVRFATTEWIQQEVIRQTGVECGLVGPCFDVNLFRPRPRLEAEWPYRPLRIAAMIRPESHYRAPRFTMEVLKQIDQRFGSRVEIVLFGVNPDNLDFAHLPQDLAWRLAGKLNRRQMARLLNEVDIFVDFSSHQALGITAQEAMACGVAVIVPARGGTSCFARDGENCLVVDTSSPQACEQALRRLIEDHKLRAHLQSNAIHDVTAFYPEKPTFNILDALFSHHGSRSS